MYCEENGKVTSSRTSARSLWGSYLGAGTFPSWPSRGVVCAEQDTLLDCPNEETVYLSSTSNNDRDKCAQFFQKRKHPNVLSLPISWCKHTRHCWFQATNLKLLKILAKMDTWGSHETGQVGPAQHCTVRLKHVYFYSNRTHFLIKLLRGYYIITIQVFGKPAMIKI